MPENQRSSAAEQAADAMTIAASVTRERGPDHATITINTPEGPAWIQSVDPNKVEIGSINIGDGSGIEIHTKGAAEIGELNVGTTAILASEFDETLGTESGAFAFTMVASLLIVCILVGMLGWRALSGSSNQSR